MKNKTIKNKIINKSKKKSKKKTIKNINKLDIKKLTDYFMNNIINNNPKLLNNLFCQKGILIGTLSQKIRTKNSKFNILNYFNYFANLKGIKILSKKYNINKIESNIFVNNAEVKWKWDKIKKPIIARMTFIFKDNCLYLLHSSGLPKANQAIK